MPRDAGIVIGRHVDLVRPFRLFGFLLYDGGVVGAVRILDRNIHGRHEFACNDRTAVLSFIMER